MSNATKEMISIALLLKKHRAPELRDIQHAAEFAFYNAPAAPRVAPLKSACRAFGIILGPMRFAVLCVDKPFIKDIAAAADRMTDFAARRAMQQHTAWMSVDFFGDPGTLDRGMIHLLIGRLIAELLQPDVLGLVRLPDSTMVGYDVSYIPKLRTGKVSEVFGYLTPDRPVRIRDTAALRAATDEARRRWPEFLAAFNRRRANQGFGVKKAFVSGNLTEHMWVSVGSIQGSIIRGRLSNTPAVITSLRYAQPIVLRDTEVEDWMYTDGLNNIGGFGAEAYRKSRCE